MDSGWDYSVFGRSQTTDEMSFDLNSVADLNLSRKISIL